MKDLDDRRTDELPFLRTAYNYDRNHASDVSGLECDPDEGLTKQSFAEEADINVLVERFGLGAALPVDAPAPTYLDYDGVFDYQTALNAIASANEAFMLMPANVRARFNNDPGKFVDFCSSAENRAEAEKLGLVVPRDPGPVPGAGAAGAPVSGPAGPVVTDPPKAG